jgi:hypothetical protein
MSSEEQINDELFGLVHKMIEVTSVNRLHQLTEFYEPVLAENIEPEEDLTTDHWISTTSVRFPGLSFEFRVHFSSRQARQLAGQVLNREEDESYPAALCMSSMTEFCHVTACAAKSIVSRALTRTSGKQFSIDASLPITTPSYDETLLKNDTDGGPQHMWKLTSRGHARALCGNHTSIDPHLLDQVYGVSLEHLVPVLKEVAAVQLCSDFETRRAA